MHVGDAGLGDTEDADDAADSESVTEEESSESDEDDDESNFNVDSLIIGTNTGISCTFDFTGI